MNAASDFQFRWRSPLGVSVALFLLFGALNIFLGIAAPAVQQLGEANILVLNPELDAMVFGRSPSELLRTYPFLATYRIIQADWKYANVMAVGIFNVALAWFGLRRGHKWAVWTLALGNFVMVPYWLFVFDAYLSRGVPFSLSLIAVPLFTFPGFVVPIAAVLGWIGLR